MGGAGSPGDHPLTDLLLWDRHPFPMEIETRVLYLRDVSPRSLDKIDLREFLDWQNNRNLDEGYAHLDGLIDEYRSEYVKAFGSEPQLPE